MFTFEINGSWEKASSLEWLETNGLGGYASSTAAFANRRRYHGLLVAAVHPPVGRMVMLSKLDEKVLSGSSSFDLSANQFPGAIHPTGHEHLRLFSRGLFPVFEYAAGPFHIRKTVAAIHGENTTLITYEVLSAAGKFVLELRPFIAARDHHHLSAATGTISSEARFRDGILEYRPWPQVPAMFIAAPGTTFSHEPDWHYRFEYDIERERGLPFHEDLFTPGKFRVSLGNGDRFTLAVSLDRELVAEGAAKFEQERSRRESLLSSCRLTGSFAHELVGAADQFIVKRGNDRRTIIAGYPWFTDWGRDTMIALPGLCLATGRYDDARRILLAFSESVSDGMIPNRFPDGGEHAEYNTVDATLWFFIAGWKYLQASGDQSFVRQVLLPCFRDIIGWHDRGTRHGIHVEEDGLLSAGAGNDQLTWMDARCDGHAFTPRHGKPVEINALWYNALSIRKELEERFGSPELTIAFQTRASRVYEQFNSLFWNDREACLFDGIADDGTADRSMRPNQIFALSLPFPLLSGTRAESVLASVTRHLLTPRGLRTLSPDDPRFRSRYEGNQWERDGAYHQGTVWSWLLGPYITALIRTHGEAGRDRARVLLERFRPHLLEACVGTISEIFDGSEPHHPRGCIAQAWSVGEFLRVISEDLEMEPESRN